MLTSRDLILRYRNRRHGRKKLGSYYGRVHAHLGVGGQYGDGDLPTRGYDLCADVVFRTNMLMRITKTSLNRQTKTTQRIRNLLSDPPG